MLTVEQETILVSIVWLVLTSSAIFMIREGMQPEFTFSHLFVVSIFPVLVMFGIVRSANRPTEPSTLNSFLESFDGWFGELNAASYLTVAGCLLIGVCLLLHWSATIYKLKLYATIVSYWVRARKGEIPSVVPRCVSSRLSHFRFLSVSLSPSLSLTLLLSSLHKHTYTHYFALSPFALSVFLLLSFVLSSLLHPCSLSDTCFLFL